MKRRTHTILPAADRDLIKIANYIARDSRHAAERFIERALESIEFITRLPGAGSRYDAAPAQLGEVRRWAVKGFPNYLIFYKLEKTRVKIIRVLHGARDIGSILRDVG